MSECICSQCGQIVYTRSEFEQDCPECGGDLIEQDAYDPPPRELICIDCGLKVSGGGCSQALDEFYEGRYSVDDPCPRCEGPLDPDISVERSIREGPQIKVAKGAAQKLIKKHAINGQHIDVEALANAEGLEIVRGKFDHEGTLNGEVIEVPLDESPAAQRFLIAHELGHWYLKHKFDLSAKQMEPEANAFAAELIMPADELREAVQRGLTFHQLCSHFGSSRQATIYALMSTRLIDQLQQRSADRS